MSRNKQQARGRRRVQRPESRLPIFSIVGDTHAGKSTLLNALTASDIKTGNRRFETLDTTTRRLPLLAELELRLDAGARLKSSWGRLRRHDGGKQGKLTTALNSSIPFFIEHHNQRVK